MKNVKSGNVQINYTITGNGEKTLLFVHGSFIDHTWWSDQINYFKENYKVVAMDLAGHGQSGKNRKIWTVKKFGDDVIAVMKQLELKNVILIGHSMGADAALEAAVSYPGPVEGIIGIDILKNAGTAMPAEAQRQANELIAGLETDFENASEGYARMLLLTQQTNKSLTDRVARAYRNADPVMGAASTKDLLKYYNRERKLLKQLKFRLCLINVDYMPTNEQPLKEYAAGGYELFNMHGTCHFPMVENPGVFNGVLEQVLSAI